MSITINFNYTRAINQAKQLESAAQDLRGLAEKDMQRSIDGISVSWKGEAASQFISYCTTVQGDLKSEATHLEETARRIRQAAQTIRDAELKNLELQSNRAKL